MRTSSGTVTSPIFGKIMGLAHKDLQYKEVEQPSGISKIAVCMDSGLKPTSLCTQDPRGSRVYYDWFINGSAPTQYCNYHTKSHNPEPNPNTNNSSGVNEGNKQQENKTEEVKPNENNNKPNEQNPNTKPDNTPGNGNNTTNNNGGENVTPPQNQTENNTNNGVITPPQAGNNQNQNGQNSTITQ